MRLTRGSVYALRALEYLAALGDGRPATAHEIAVARGAPGRFLLRPLKALVSAGLLRSAPGPGGGYRLGRPASRITLPGRAVAASTPGCRGSAKASPTWCAAGWGRSAYRTSPARSRRRPGPRGG